MAEPLRHRQTKEAATDMFSLQPPRHIPTLPRTDQSATSVSGLLMLNEQTSECRESRRFARPVRDRCRGFPPSPLGSMNSRNRASISSRDREGVSFRLAYKTSKFRFEP